MENNLPDERSITKQQLWQRDNLVIDTNNLNVKNFSDQLDQTVTKLQITFDEKIKELKSATYSTIDSFNKKNEHIKKDYELLLTTLNNEVIKLIQKQDVESKQAMIDFRKEVNLSIQTQIQSSFEKIFEEIQKINKNVTTYKKEVSEQVQKTQIEMNQKIGLTTKLFTDIKDKFKKIAQQLQ